MAQQSRSPNVLSSPIRVVLAVVAAFVGLIVVLLIVRPNMMYSMIHDIMVMM